ncbi:hypothetical protein BHAOGJBA_5962 [Methylobacterium hispanicum]|uniref:Uncharacterized protein n=1 Tax=Methylobacterium hispanicum TaxID=270350 RepID=A0AAV4ZVY2_9HYPH|nr:hypothetical protein [Methylobacterium hispanicum]GJD92408.1 hypothetical protein BHAOGJBA_5962 [Methylobacterium hispanicum]
MSARAKSDRASLPARVAETPLALRPPALVLFGRDGGGRPRAAWFDAADAEAATAAAAIMRLRALPLTDDAGRALAARLARGRVLPSGRAFVPSAKRDVYARLIALAGEEAGLAVAVGGRADPPGANNAPSSDPPGEADPPAAEEVSTAPSSGEERPSDEEEAPSPPADEPAGAPSASRPGAHLFVGQPRPGDRGEIGLGSIVLAHEGPDDGWWEAEVIGANGRTFSLRWRDYDPMVFPTILRTADELALLPPGAP